MAVHDRPPVTLVRVGGRRSRWSAWVAAGLVGAGLIGIVGVAALGDGRLDDPPVVPTPANTAAPAATSIATVAPAGPPISGRTRVLAPAGAGYVVTYARDPSHRPVVFDRGALAIFGYGERVPDGTYPGTIRVAVGTPARGAPLPGSRGQRLVYADSLDLLRAELLADDPIGWTGRVTYAIDGAPADIWEAPRDADRGPRAIALTVHGMRAFLITAAGFEPLWPGVPNPANAGLVRFLAGFRFTTPLYVDRELGFQVPQPVDVLPTMDDGAVVFSDGERTPDGAFSHAISVSVGTRERPAAVQVLPGGDPPRVARVWAGSLIELQGAYLAAIGDRTGSSTTIRLGGELALLVERPNGLAATVLAVRDGRVYLVSTTGLVLREAAPGFEEFLDGFTFLDPE